jgi:hypothetical protein
MPTRPFLLRGSWLTFIPNKNNLGIPVTKYVIKGGAGFYLTGVSTFLRREKQNHVKLSHSIRPNLSRFTFVFFGLVISVFTWGLQYKLSLYYPPHSTYHQIPEAKLLSRDERAAATESPIVISTKAPSDIVHGWLFTLALFVLVLGLLHMPGASQREQERKRPWRVSCNPALNAFFFRPPPVLA